MAANVDLTLPSERGLLPGNGSMVAALRAATECEPQVAGKPQPTLLNDALARGNFQTPLVVGDRIDTDIAGAAAAELPSLMVLSGVSTADDMLRAGVGERPTYVGTDLRSLYARTDPLLRDALARGHFDRPLVVGDRLDTDIAGAVAVGLPSLMVLSGVSTADDMLRATASERPDYVATDLRSLYARTDSLRIGPHPAWRVDTAPSAVTVHSTGRDAGDPLSVVRATASAVWNARIDGQPFTVSAGDDAARRALERWSLLTPPNRLA